jgi:hypothetical protein
MRRSEDVLERAAVPVPMLFEPCKKLILYSFYISMWYSPNKFVICTHQCSKRSASIAHVNFRPRGFRSGVRCNCECFRSNKTNSVVRTSEQVEQRPNSVTSQEALAKFRCDYTKFSSFPLIYLHTILKHSCHHPSTGFLNFHKF